MARIAVILVLILVAGFSWLFSACAHGAGVDAGSELWVWVKFYREGLRTPFFSGFLTVGGFLLTLKTTILLRIKEIYDTEQYLNDWQNFQEQRRRANPAAQATDYYGPLRNLGIGLLANVVLTLVSAMLQVTLGFVNQYWAVGICLGFAASTLLLLLFLWWQIAANLMHWFKVIEVKKKDEIQKKSNPEQKPK